MEKKSLIKAAKEFNRVIELADDNGKPIKFNLNSETLEKDLYDELHHIEEGDKFTDEAEAIFKELRAKFEVKTESKPKVKKEKKSKKGKTVEVGTTVELEIDTDKIKNGKMKKSEKGADNAQMRAAQLVCSKTAKKDELMNLLDEGEIYTKKQVKALKAVTNFLSLKKQMKELLEPDVVAKVEADLKAAPKPKAKSKVKKAKEDPIVAEIKSAIKVKQLKKIAKANDQFNWKVLKALDFDEMQKAMLSGAKPVVKIKMVANPMIAEIEGFKKAKKLVKWAKAQEEIGFQKSMKKLDLADLQEALVASIPAEIEAESGGKRGTVVNHIDQEARKARIIEMVDAGTYTRKEMHVVLETEFPEEGKAHTNSNILSEMKSTAAYKDGQRWQTFGIGRLVTANAEGHLVWADAKPKKEKKAKSGKKDKKNKKSKK